MRPLRLGLVLVLVLLGYQNSNAFTTNHVRSSRRSPAFFVSSSSESPVVVDTIDGATKLLADWDKRYNPENPHVTGDEDQNADENRPILPDAVRFLVACADKERAADSLKGRCMLGICASSAAEGLQTLKAWVTALQLPRGLLHGMDKDGVPLEINGGVYIKYNTGGCLTFSQIRSTGMGFDALWKPGDAMLETYDGTYRGVYVQVELEDGEFRQYLVPLDTFVLEG
mmetsp:Transcript_7680/g.8381  ORF Transcript_7680/g.8381 Transcript_7680/m.8381 type:complete len:227 (-) Transcript_7680:143-823(-)